MLGPELLHVSLREVGVDLDLVDRRHHRGAIKKRREVPDHEVADSDRAHLVLSEQRLQGTVGLQRPLERGRQRLVQDQQVDLVNAQLKGALLEAVQRLVVSVVADPDLGLQEDFGPVQLGAAHCLADLALVSVGRRRVDVSVPGAECGADGISGLVRGRLEDAEAERGHLHPVVQLQRRGGGLGHGRARCCRVGLTWASAITAHECFDVETL